MPPITRLAVESPSELLFGAAPNPVQVTPEITIGAGEVLPEVNYTLPHGAPVTDEAMDQVTAMYAAMARAVLQRASDLGAPRVVIEIELVFELTLNPAWGERVVQATREAIDEFAGKGVHAALRTTVADIRDRRRPPKNRTSVETQLVLETFERCAPLSDILSIETTGGKEVSDPAILNGDIGGALFALGHLGSNDMAFMWERIVEIAHKHGITPGGDAACGFANTAMQLARKRMIPTVFAAIVRAAGAARSLTAIEQGATGPDKDCAYEGPILKAIAGIPIAMEGKSAACAHSSHIGNVAMACADLWSNESVPYVQLFGGHTPETCFEELWYDCKLMNQSTKRGQALVLRDLLVESDICTSPEALVLAPDSCLRIARAIIRSADYGQRAYLAAREALAILDEAVATERLAIPDMEAPWLDFIRAGLDEFSVLDGRAVDYYAARYQRAFVPTEYGL